MRASRLLSILILLQLRGRVSADALAREFEVSVRTIYRDIDELSLAGVPVYAERGRSGGFALEDGYRTRLTGLTAGEAETLFFSGAGAAAADLGFGPDLAAAQLKLLASLPADLGKRAERVAARFHLDPAPWYAASEPPPHLAAAAASVWRETRICIRYESWKAVVARTLDPIGLVLKGGVWYLVAAANGRPRTYRVSNILSLDPLAAPARRLRGFKLERYWRDWSRDFEKRRFGARARLRLTPAGARLLRDNHPIAAEALKAAVPVDGGAVEATVPIEDGEAGALQILRLGGECEVLEPKTLRDTVLKSARAVAKLYAR
jgi:predicted DNA-binding transcriptional regulator YafY